MSSLPEKPAMFSDHLILKLAREIAMDINPLETILASHNVNNQEWEVIAASNTYQRLFRQQVEAWNSASNTAERVKLKSLSFVEEALPEFWQRAHDPKESLQHKTEVLKTVARFAGVGGSVDNAAMVGEKFSVTINLGGPDVVKITKDITPAVIDITPDE